MKKLEYIVISKGLATHRDFSSREEAEAAIDKEFGGDNNASIEEHINGEFKHMAKYSGGMWLWNKVNLLSTD